MKFSDKPEDASEIKQIEVRLGLEISIKDDKLNCVKDKGEEPLNEVFIWKEIELEDGYENAILKLNELKARSATDATVNIDQELFKLGFFRMQEGSLDYVVKKFDSDFNAAIQAYDKEGLKLSKDSSQKSTPS